MSGHVDSRVQREASAAACEVAAELGRFAGGTTVGYRDIEHALRTEFVLAAANRLERSGTPPTAARLALSTGLPKSLVEQTLATRDPAQPKRSIEDINEDGFFAGLELLCSLWATDTRFTAVYGVPRDLVIRRSPESADTLEDLAELALPGVPFERVLSSLREQGLVQFSEERSKARIVGHAVHVGNNEARVVARYGRLVAGLMRTLRANWDSTVDPDALKPLELTLTTDRPIARAHIDSFLDFVEHAASAWLRGIEAEQQAFIPARDLIGSRYAVCCYVSEDLQPGMTRVPSVSAFSARLPFVKCVATVHRLDADAYARFRREVSETCDRWLLTLDAEQRSLFAAPGEDGVVLKVCCFVFPVTGTEGRTDEHGDIDLVEGIARRRIYS